ncbi:unnamed protein product, partial [Discosporangium mesarthrocarpum]
MIDPLIILVLSVSLALLFFMAARHKMSAPQQFAAQLEAYELLPRALVAPVSRVLPLLEMTVVFLVLVPQTRAFAALLAAALLFVYGLAMAINMVRGRADIDCGCGGQPQVLSAWLLLRNTALIAGSCLLLAPTSDRAITLSDLLFLILMTTLLAMVYLLVEQ